MILIVEDPLRDVLYPESYPPDRNLFEIFIAGRLGDLEENREDDVDKNIMYDAIDIIKITKISGHHAALFQTELEKTFIGKAYIRGAEVITEERDISIVLMGSIESGVER